MTLHKDHLPRDTARRGQQGQELERELPAVLPEFLEAATPEAAIAANLSPDVPIAEPTNSFNRQKN